MNSTWVDNQFDKLEAAYNEVPIKAKARISELENALNDVADKWAQAQIEAEDYARRNKLLESLVRDMMELDEMRHMAWSLDRYELMQDMRYSINARLIKMGFVKEVDA